MAQRNNHGLVSALMQKMADNGKGYDPTEPLHTAMAGAPRHYMATAHLAQFNTNPNGTVNAGHSPDDPVSTIATKGPHQAVCTSHVMNLRGTCQHGATVEEPAPTLTASGNHIAEVRAFLIKYFGTDQDPQLGETLHTVTTKIASAL